MLKTLNCFLSVSRYDLGYLGPVSPNCSNALIPIKQVYYKTGISQPSEGLDTRAKAEDFPKLH